MTPPVSENWEAYLCMVEDKPASILVNLDLMRQAPFEDFPVLWHLGLSLHAPDENGLPGREEYEELNRIEDALSAALQDAVYAGRSIRDGEADFFFYLPCLPAAPLLPAAGKNGDDLEAALSGYDWESGAGRDPGWSVYKDFLFPGEYDMLAMQNRRTASRLEHKGDAPELARPVEHWLDFPSPREREQAAHLAREQGFAAVEDELSGGKDKEEEREHPACLRLVRQDTLKAIDDVVFSLARLAGEYGGRYRGWVCAPALDVPSPDGENSGNRR